MILTKRLNQVHSLHFSSKMCPWNKLNLINTSVEPTLEVGDIDKLERVQKLALHLCLAVHYFISLLLTLIVSWIHLCLMSVLVGIHYHLMFQILPLYMHLRSLFVTLSELFYTVGVHSISLAICTSFAVLCINVIIIIYIMHKCY